MNLNWIKNSLKIVFINIVILINLLVIVEIVGQVYFYYKNGYWLLIDEKPLTINQQVFKQHPYLVGVLKENIHVKDINHGTNKYITTTNIGTRITDIKNKTIDLKKKNKIRIVILGGSTAFCTGVSDENSWPFVLKQKLGKNYEIINLGVPGYSTAEGIIQMSLIVPTLKPDIIIFYEGWNDIRNYHNHDKIGDYYKHGLMQFSNLSIKRYLKKKYMIYDMTFLGKTYDQFMNFLKQKQKKSKKKEEFYYTDKGIDKFIDSIYERNLRSLLALSKTINTIPIFIPQVLNNENFLKNPNKFSNWTPYILNKNMPKYMKHFNDIMKKVCQNTNDKCIFISNVINYNWTLKDFVDDGHFSKKGNQIFSNMLIDTIKEINVSNQ